MVVTSDAQCPQRTRWPSGTPRSGLDRPAPHLGVQSEPLVLPAGAGLICIVTRIRK